AGSRAPGGPGRDFSARGKNGGSVTSPITRNPLSDWSVAQAPKLPGINAPQLAISGPTVLPSGASSTPHAVVRLSTSSSPRPRTRPSGSVERRSGPGNPTGEASRTDTRSPRGPRSSVRPTPVPACSTALDTNSPTTNSAVPTTS